MKTHIERFSRRQRLEHVAVMLLFTLLALTGLPQKFYDSGWARVLAGIFGDVRTMRQLHRVAGVLFSLLVFWHVGLAIAGVLARRARLASMVPTRKDFLDAIQTLRYYLGIAPAPPSYDRFDYRQKFEYWGLVIGSVVMVGTGFILLYPTRLASLLPAELIPVAKVAHSSEGLMAFLVVILWHVYNAHLNPDVFPFDTSIFTGRISRERMAHEHPIELARIEAEEKGERASD